MFRKRGDYICNKEEEKMSQQARPVSSGASPPARRGYSSVTGSYGMLGLQGVLQNDTNTLTNRGYDLNTLGLNLASTEPLYPTFANPWADGPSKVQPEFRIPQCYYVNPPHLKFAMFQKFQLDSLFYIFYSMPRDVLQLAAAQELYNRDWRFHKELGVWMTRVPGVEPTMKTDTFEQGSFFFFNPDRWNKERRDNVTLKYEQIEEKEAPQQQQAPPGQPRTG